MTFYPDNYLYDYQYLKVTKIITLFLTLNSDAKLDFLKIYV